MTRQQAEAMVPGGTLTLTEQSSHAWTEYYLDGVGWLPFDAAPGYTDLVEYRLPENGPEGENGQGDTPCGHPRSGAGAGGRPGGGTAPGPAGEICPQCPADPGGGAGAGTAGPDRPRPSGPQAAAAGGGPVSGSGLPHGCGYILCAVHDLLGQPGLPEDPLSPEDAEDLVYLEREVWYSGHTMTEDQRRRCLALLESARRVWREQTPALRRFAARFITCKVF